MKIVAIDDSQFTLGMIRLELESPDYEIVEVSNPDLALQVIDREKPDLVTMDVEMPRTSGFELCSQLRKLEQEADTPFRLPVVFVTGMDKLADREKGFLLGAADFITKPFVKGELKNVIDHILRPEIHVNESKVLVVDDNQMVRKIVTSCLNAEGIQTITAGNGQEALDAIKADIHGIDLIISDFDMPVMNGLLLCKTVRNELGIKHIPFIVLSAYPEKNCALEMYKAGASDFVIKPFLKEEFVSRVRLHLENTRMLKQLQKTVKDLKRLTKIKNHVLAIASHDIRSPIAGIVACMELLQEREYLETEDKDLISMTIEGGNFVLNLVSELLDLALLESDKSSLERLPIDLVDILQTSVRLLRQSAVAKSISMGFTPQSAPAKILGDKNALMRIFSNLIGNALKFTPASGSVNITLTPSDAGTHVTITDTGIGISKDKLASLFNAPIGKSQRGTAGERGTGLGLGITRTLVQRLGGQLTVESKEGVGTTVNVTFPTLSQ